MDDFEEMDFDMGDGIRVGFNRFDEDEGGDEG